MAKRTLDDFFGKVTQKEGEKKRAREQPASRLPRCKYGPKCYRKNPAHFKEFSHDDDDQGEENRSEKQSVEEKERQRSASPEVQRPPENREASSSGHPLKMPPDFYDILADLKRLLPDCDFNSTSTLPIANNSIQLTGAFDVENGLLMKLEKLDQCQISAHGRFKCDPIEAQTVIVCNQLNVHLAYWRDEPEKVIGVVAIRHHQNGNAKSKSADKTGSQNFPKITYVGDNFWLLNQFPADARCEKFALDCQKAAERKKHVLGSNTEAIRRRRKDVCAPTLHGFGICVSVKDDVGYRPLSESNADLKKLLTTLGETDDGALRTAKLAKLQEMITYVQFANDECDFGMGLELGHDLIVAGYSILKPYIKQLLPVAYLLLQRNDFQTVLDAHLNYVWTCDNNDGPFNANTIEIDKSDDL